MDTSKKYIKMCEKAEEIQGQRHIPTDWQKGDWFLRVGTPWVEVVSHQVTFLNLPIPIGTVWLPRQDQLQEMINKDWYRVINRFYDYITKKGYGDRTEPGEYEEPDLALILIQQFDSMEQLWLAFVMKEKYNKIWEGKNWKEVS